MDISALKAFVAVAEQRSFSLAADKLFLTQPAVSKRVAALEEELQARLFDRIGHRITLTEAGSALLPRARHILLELEDSVREISNLGQEVHGTLRFGTSHHIGLHRLPDVLRDFVRAYPQVEMDIRFMDSEQACQAVEHGELELAVVTLPPSPSPALRTELVWKDPLCVATYSDHPLKKRKRVTLRELSRHPVILPASNTFTRQVAEQAFDRLGLELDLALSTNYLETIKMLVSVGIGWSLLPLTMIDGQVSVVRVAGLDLQRELGIVRHRERTLSNAARSLIEGLRRYRSPERA